MNWHNQGGRPRCWLLGVLIVAVLLLVLGWCQDGPTLHHGPRPAPRSTR